MSRFNQSAYGAMQGHDGEEPESVYPPIASRVDHGGHLDGANGHLDMAHGQEHMHPSAMAAPAQSPYAQFTLRPDNNSYYPPPRPPLSLLDPQILADDAFRNQQSPGQSTGMAQSHQAQGTGRNGYVSILPKPGSTVEQRGVSSPATWNSQAAHAAPTATGENGFIDSRLHEAVPRDYRLNVSHAGLNSQQHFDHQQQQQQQHPSASFTGHPNSPPYPQSYAFSAPPGNMASATGHDTGDDGHADEFDYGRPSKRHRLIEVPTPAPATEKRMDRNPIDYATDALLERQMHLQNASDDESESERIGDLPFYNEDGEYDDEMPRSRRTAKSRARGGKARGGTKRGPRKAAEPTGDVKYRLNMASNAYMDGRLDEAIEWVEDAIRINAETYRAWMLLTTLLEEKGDHKGSFTARVFSCHLQPRHVEGWLHCAELGIALRDELPEHADEFLNQAATCYSAALRADIENKQARHGRAAISVERGQIRTAAKDYLYLLEHDPYDVHALRSYAEMTIMLAGTRNRQYYKPETAIEHYYRAIDHFQLEEVDGKLPFEWQDINIFVGLLAYVEHFKDAIFQLKSLSRWLLGRFNEDFWDDWQDDDREWDLDNARRVNFRFHEQGGYSGDTYGGGLPLELRTKLAVYRLKLGDISEAKLHIAHLDPDSPNWTEIVANEPSLLVEIATALYEAERPAEALRFFEPLLSVAEALDTNALLTAGRCYLETGDKRQAEECFGAVIDIDDANDEASIDARYELAKMYEAAKEDQEAYILVSEAIRLQRDHDEAEDENDEDEDMGSDDDLRNRSGADALRRERMRKRRALGPRKPRAPRSTNSRPRRKVFGRTEETTLEEKRRAEELNLAWATVNQAREQASVENAAPPARDDDASSTSSASSTTTDDDDADIVFSDDEEPPEPGPSNAFMRAAKQLVDDFRSCKGFYSWEKFLTHLGIDEDKQVYVPRNRNLIEMKERLSHNLEPTAERQLGEKTAVSYRGVSFSEWLELFLEYAIGLAHQQKYQEAYHVCESARDAEVFAKNKDDMFLIHVTWASCALRARDEETCVASARFLMRDRQFDTDPFRFFAALCRLCQSPASWYASGPVQKYMLRQIKLMDRALRSGDIEDSEDEGEKTNGEREYSSNKLDITLLVLYGHILFVSNSFTYALNYFLRAYSVDPTNHMVLLSVGQCYIHYALKRQSENRQYLLLQGLCFLRKYYDAKVVSEDAAVRQEAHYNMARSYHAIGINHLAVDFYRRALNDRPDDGHPDIFGPSDLAREAAYNLQQLCLAGGDMAGARYLAETYLTL